MECTFIKMQEIKAVYWRKLLCTPVGSCRFFTFVYSAEIKNLVLKSQRSLGDLNTPLATEVWMPCKTDVHKPLSPKSSGDIPGLQEMEI